MTNNLQKKLNKYFAGKKVDRAILFGSHARRTYTKRSDYDIIIIHETNEKFFDRFNFFNDIYKILGNQVDMLIYNPREWENIKDRIFFRKILKEAVNIYVKRKKQI